MSMSVLNIFGKPLDANFVSNALICNDFTPPVAVVCEPNTNSESSSESYLNITNKVHFCALQSRIISCRN